jgi:hypothetical protein
VSERILPVKQWYVRLERVHDEESALDAWRALVKAQGWSAVGDPEVVRHDDPRHKEGTPFVIGLVVEHPGLTVRHDARQVVLP